MNNDRLVLQDQLALQKEVSKEFELLNLRIDIADMSKKQLKQKILRICKEKTDEINKLSDDLKIVQQSCIELQRRNQDALARLAAFQSKSI